MAKITNGSLLNFIRDENVTCKVISSSRVEFEGADHSLSSAALIATNRMGFNWKTIAGPLKRKHQRDRRIEGQRFMNINQSFRSSSLLIS